MARIIGGGGKLGSNNKTVGRPGFAQLNNPSSSPRGVISGAKRTVQRLIARDPAKGNSLIGTGQDLTYTAEQAVLATALTGTNNDLKFTAHEVGVRGNDIRVRYVVSGNNTPLTVSVSAKDITVNVATDGGGAATSTATQVKDAVNAFAAAKALVLAELAAGNDGTGIVTALSFTALAGGKDFDKVGVDVAGSMGVSPTQMGLNSGSMGGTRAINTSDTRQRVRDRSKNRSLRRI